MTQAEFDKIIDEWIAEGKFRPPLNYKHFEGLSEREFSKDVRQLDVDHIVDLAKHYEMPQADALRNMDIDEARARLINHVFNIEADDVEAMLPNDEKSDAFVAPDGVESGNEEAIADDARRDAVDSDGLLEEGAPGTGEIPDSGGVEGRGERDGDARQDGDGYAEGGVSEDDGRRGVVGGEGDVSGASGMGIRKDGGRKGRGKGGKKTALGSQPGTGEATGGDGGKSGTLNPRDNIAGTEPALAGENPGNFSVSEGFSFVLGTPKEKLEANLNAIRTLKQVLDEERYATPEEQAVMAKFVGWGGLPNVFKDESELSGMWLGAHRELKWLFNSRAEWGMSAWNDAMASTRNAHYTSEKVVRMMWDAVRHFGFEGGVALEPTVGVGNFISLQPKDLASATEWHATELDVVTGQLATMLFPNAHVIGGIGFEYAKFRNGVFDIAIGNPPFARDAVRTHAKGYEELKGLSLHNFIVGKSGKHLRPGGVMAMVITHHFLDAGDTRGRAQLAKDFKFLGAVRLPNTAFKANAGTEVTTDIIFLQKLHEGESPDMKAAWLDSSGKVTNKAGEPVFRGASESYSRRAFDAREDARRGRAHCRRRWKRFRQSVRRYSCRRFRGAEGDAEAIQEGFGCFRRDGDAERYSRWRYAS